MSHDVAVQVIPAEMHIPQFGITVPVLRVAGMGDYFPVRAFCKAIGLTSQPQVERIQSDADLAAGAETFTVPTSGGPQEALCLRKKELAWWIATMEPRTIRKLEARFSTTLDDFKKAVMAAADVLWWGAPRTSTPKALPAAEPSGAFYLHCRRCHARHRLELFGSGMYNWEIEE